MRYRSTRRGAGEVGFEEAILEGIAPDGGLYWPTAVPPLPDGWAAAGSPAALARLVLPVYMGEEAAEAVAQGLDFPWPVVELPGDVYLLELFHGPTAAFKDVGARSLARSMGAALERRGAAVTVLVATSGDTGSAVADAFSGVPNVRVAVLYPSGGVSPVQEAQLTAERPGVRAFAVKGTFDDCQRLVKAAFADLALEGLRLTSANSINVGRLLPQALYYLWGAARVWEARGAEEALRVVVPSGNLGNLTAGMLAAEAGLAVAGFLAAHNRNDYFPRYLAGAADAFAFAAGVATPSNAMDVGAPSNFERLHAWLGEDMRRRVKGLAIDDDATFATMRATSLAGGRLVCPHTAVGLAALERLRAATEGEAAVPALVLATAHPAKFPEAVLRATGMAPDVPAQLRRFAAAPKRVEFLQPESAALRAALLDWPD